MQSTLGWCDQINKTPTTVNIRCPPWWLPHLQLRYHTIRSTGPVLRSTSTKPVVTLHPVTESTCNRLTRFRRALEKEKAVFLYSAQWIWSSSTLKALRLTNLATNNRSTVPTVPSIPNSKSTGRTSCLQKKVAGTTTHPGHITGLQIQQG